VIKYIFFDNDGVLVDTEKYFFYATRDTLARYGIVVTEEEFIELTLVGNEGAWGLARKKNYSEEQINSIRNERNEEYARYLKSEKLIIEGVEEVLGKLSGKYKMGIVTSSKRSHFDLIHSGTNILHYFDFILTIEDYGKSKPSPEPYLKAIEMSRCKPEECIVIEDSERGLVSATEAGMQCIVIPHHLTKNCDFSRAWKILDTIKQLPGCL